MFESIFRFCEKALFASLRIWSGFFGLLFAGRVSRWITAESTFGFGLKCFAETVNAREGFA